MELQQQGKIQGKQPLLYQPGRQLSSITAADVLWKCRARKPMIKKHVAASALSCVQKGGWSCSD